uniref:Uncharacterized protein n=1 Tax=Nelumbo nucifera TaxID=4432 RepID=A0A822ZPE3_NELNU|nr:TPA_asm: hypothetical protein HUJ06_017781 [Nelumbo nucifera]
MAEIEDKLKQILTLVDEATAAKTPLEGLLKGVVTSNPPPNLAASFESAVTMSKDSVRALTPYTNKNQELSNPHPPVIVPLLDDKKVPTLPPIVNFTPSLFSTSHPSSLFPSICHPATLPVMELCTFRPLSSLGLNPLLQFWQPEPIRTSSPLFLMSKPKFPLGKTLALRSISSSSSHHALSSTLDPTQTIHTLSLQKLRWQFKTSTQTESLSHSPYLQNHVK